MSAHPMTDQRSTDTDSDTADSEQQAARREELKPSSDTRRWLPDRREHERDGKRDGERSGDEHGDASVHQATATQVRACLSARHLQFLRVRLHSGPPVVSSTSEPRSAEYSVNTFKVMPLSWQRTTENELPAPVSATG